VQSEVTAHQYTTYYVRVLEEEDGTLLETPAWLIDSLLWCFPHPLGA